MTRGRVGLAFILCAAALIGVLAWLTLRVQRLETARRQDREQAALEESVRLALWRLESLLTPLIAQEGARPYAAYLSGGASPSLRAALPRTGGFPVPYVRLHFQWAPPNRLSSPALAASPAEVSAVAGQRETAQRLRSLASLTNRAELARRLGDAWQRIEVEQRPAPQRTAAESAKTRERQVFEKAMVAKGLVPKDVTSEAQQQAELNTQEWKARMANADINLVRPQTRQAPETRPSTSASAQEVRTGVMQPLWVGGELLLVRRVRIGAEETLQGCWLDWPALSEWLSSAVRDLLPEARLELVRLDAPVARGVAGARLASDKARRLAALPVRLVPGPPAVGPASLPSVGQLPLAGAWVFAGLALAAVGLLLHGMVTLSERRAAFVSAVTHELRTPLTTFRMYADMLAEGMVADEAQQHEYLMTLKREAERQSHLVENVLAYSRLERGRYTAAQEDVSVGELLNGVERTLSALAQRASLRLASACSSECRSVRVRVDRAGVERILVNLVDNACKYARQAGEAPLELDCQATARDVRLCVSDHGPGLTPGARRRLFRPFEKSAVDAAHSAPGVGLGLALSRRLARTMGGELELLATGPSGTRFCLRLPRL